MIELSVPSKTFLVGEYIALHGETSLVLNTEPRFRLSVTHSARPEGVIENISPESPAGQFLRNHCEFFKGLSIRFTDPHGGAGGLGASSAQFALCYLLYQKRKNPLFKISLSETSREKFFDEMMHDYLRVSWTGEGYAPSGADLFSQVFGEDICLLRRKPFSTTSYRWPFSDHGFFLVRTGLKKATHLHLNELESIETNNLIENAEKVKVALEKSDLSSFIDGIKGYRRHLGLQDLTCSPTLSLLNQVDQIPGVLCAKGCGALGADILFGLFPKQEQVAVKESLENLGLKVVATQLSLSEGFSLLSTGSSEQSPENELGI